MAVAPSYEPVLTSDPVANHEALAALLDTRPPGVVRLPAGTFPLSRGIAVGAGWSLAGAEPSTGSAASGPGGAVPGTWLSSASPDGEPVVHVLGSDVEIS